MGKIEMLRKQRVKANAEYLEGTLEEMQSDPHCPHCGRAHCHRHGKTKKGTPRYYCPDCRRVFVYNVQTVFASRIKIWNNDADLLNVICVEKVWMFVLANVKFIEIQLSVGGIN